MIMNRRWIVPPQLTVLYSNHCKSNDVERFNVEIAKHTRYSRNRFSPDPWLALLALPASKRIIRDSVLDTYINMLQVARLTEPLLSTRFSRALPKKQCHIEI